VRAVARARAEAVSGAVRGAARNVNRQMLTVDLGARRPSGKLVQIEHALRGASATRRALCVNVCRRRSCASWRDGARVQGEERRRDRNREKAAASGRRKVVSEDQRDHRCVLLSVPHVVVGASVRWHVDELFSRRIAGDK
jgi:hypothetical protein